MKMNMMIKNSMEEDFKFDVQTTKYQLFCSSCKTIIGYTNHLFQSGEMLIGKLILHPNGVIGKVGDPIHRCIGGSIQLRHNQNVKEKNNIGKRVAKKRR